MLFRYMKSSPATSLLSVKNIWIILQLRYICMYIRLTSRTCLQKFSIRNFSQETVKMSTEDFFTSELITELLDLDVITEKALSYSREEYHFAFATSIYTDIPEVNEYFILSSVTILGLVLNAVILRSYWNIRGDIALYIRAFAIFDIFMILYQGCMRSAQLFLTSYAALIWYITVGFSLIASLVMIGPLFLALDRFLIVAFPHKFQLYLKKDANL